MKLKCIYCNKELLWIEIHDNKFLYGCQTDNCKGNIRHSCIYDLMKHKQALELENSYENNK